MRVATRGLLTLCLALTLPFATARAAEPLVTEKVTSYSVEGASADELLQQMLELGPTDYIERRAYGMTHSLVGWTYRLLDEGTTCRLQNIEVSLELEYTLPKWEPPASAPEELVSRWQVFMEMLLRHEHGHRDTAIQGAQVVQSTLEALPPEPSCQQMRRRADSEGRTVMRATLSQHAAYDRDTAHGRKQGVRFP